MNDPADSAPRRTSSPDDAASSQRLRLEFPREALDALCCRWRIRELSLFGSVLRDDFRPDSDVDVLVSFDDDARWGLWDLAALREDLENLFSRRVDLVEKEALRNPFRRQTILNERQVVYGW